MAEPRTIRSIFSSDKPKKIDVTALAREMKGEPEENPTVGVEVEALSPPVDTPFPTKVDESPAEEKIKKLVEAERAPKRTGWNNDMSTAPTDGQRVVISRDANDEGVMAYWRVTRKVDRKNLRYVTYGKWTDQLTRMDVNFEPQYWKTYVASEYWPVRGRQS
jgi:hypothetical protein